jgi:branched-subunit amino acid ABC-type transport system permease component
VALVNTQQALNMVTDGAILFILASGLAVIFGLMNVINFAHGAFIAVGAYAGAYVTTHGWNLWLSIPLALVVGMLVGLIADLLVIRRVYRRPADTILATIGLGLVVVATITITFGRESQFVDTPVLGSTDLGFATYSSYRVLLFAFAVGLFLLLAVVTRYTRLGLIARAVIANETLASALGVNSGRVRRWTFALGAGLAALAGTLVAPLAGVEPNSGERFLVDSFMVVLIAGSSVVALAIGSLLLGGLASWVAFVADPILGSMTIIVLAVIILRFLPTGLQGVSLMRLPAVRSPLAWRRHET